METETRDPEVMAEMERRVSNGLDPLTGNPFETCAPHSVTRTEDGIVCDGCGGRATLNGFGEWTHSRLIYTSPHQDENDAVCSILWDEDIRAVRVGDSVYLTGDRLATSDSAATRAGNRLMDAGFSGGICW